MKKFIIITLMMFPAFSKCIDIKMKNLISCADHKEYSIVYHEDNENGLSLRLFKGDVEIHKSLGFGVVHSLMHVNKKKSLFYTKEVDGKVIIILRGLNVDSFEDKSDAVFFNKVSFESERISPVFIKFKDGSENEFVTVSSKEKILITDKENIELKFSKNKFIYENDKFVEK